MKKYEIELERNSIGILLTLCLDPHKEPIADGRIEGNDTNTVILGGIHQISLPKLSKRLDHLIREKEAEEWRRNKEKRQKNNMTKSVKRAVAHAVSKSAAAEDGVAFATKGSKAGEGLSATAKLDAKRTAMKHSVRKR